MYSIKDIAIVILNWNGQPLLQQFLPSVVTYSDGAPVYVIDNASTDNSVAFIEKEYPKVTLIKNEDNGGYAKGYNDGLKEVNEPLLCLLNSDIEVTKDWLKPILEEFNKDEATAIIQPKILDFKRKSHFEYAGAAGGFLDKYGYPYCRGRIFDTIEEDHGQYNDSVSIFWASGACFFIKNELFQLLEGFDDNYFAHMEEIDLCWRAFNANYNARYVGTSTVYHVGGATLSNADPKKTYLNFRNSLFTLVKHTDRNVFFRTVFRMKLDGIAALRFLIQGKPKHFIAILKAHSSFYKNLSRILDQRQQQTKRPNYYRSNSIVWSYFVQKQKIF